MKRDAILVPTPHLMSINPRPAQVFVRGQGAWLWDAAGTRYLDWLQGWAVNSLGHCPPELTQALHAQAGQLISPSPALHNAPAIELATRLCELSGFAQAFFGSTGAEVNEAAIKLARKWGRLHKGGAHEIITFDHAFHGRNLSTMAASGKPGWDALFAPAMPGFVKARLNDIGSVRAALSPRTVAIMLEPVQGEAGVWPATQGFLQALRQLCDQEGLLLIFDEVQTGCARLGTLFGFEHFGVTPDIMTLGKGLGGGVPIAAVLAQARACVFEHGDHGGTYAGNPLMCAAALAVLNTLSQASFLQNVREMGQMLQQGLQQVSQRLGLGEVRGHGLLLALELGHHSASEVVHACHGLGLLVNAPRPSCLRLMPRLNSTPAEVEQGLQCLAEGLEACRAG
jgi:acetylornithine/N-succinyldiaminopimelate aminotransferase